MCFCCTRCARTRPVFDATLRSLLLLTLYAMQLSTEKWIVGGTVVVTAVEGTTGRCQGAGVYEVMSVTATSVKIGGGPGAYTTVADSAMNTACTVEGKCFMTPGDHSPAA
jgi:hypothetical protein